MTNRRELADRLEAAIVQKSPPWQSEVKAADLLEAARLLREPVAGEVEDWTSLAEAPKDGTEVDLLIIHQNAAYSADPLADGWIASLPGKWIDHNGGGWTWHGLAGKVSAWRARLDAEGKGEA